MIRPGRRGLLAAVGGIAVTAPAPALAASPDAALLAACAEAIRLGEELDRLTALDMAAEAAGDDAAAQAAFDAGQALMPSYHLALDQVWSLPATSPQGRRARVRVALRVTGYDANGAPWKREDRMVARLCADLLAVEGKI